MNVLNIEKQIGIETFLSDGIGIGGKLRKKPEDFIVSEISIKPPEKIDGKFSIAKITSTNWETNKLIKELSDKLHISRQRIGFAGTKDKRAKTTQLFSFYKINKQEIKEISIKDVEIEDVFQSDRPVKIGILSGNNFKITINDLKNNAQKKDIKKTNLTIQKNNGFPNFYGIQRFGIIRPITHIVGKYLVRADFQKAVMTYIANPIKGEDDQTYNLRKDLQEKCDFSAALKKYPDQLNFEKAMLNILVKDPDDFIGALKQLPKNLLTMFVYAYQSFLFNKILSMRIKKGLPLNNAIIGDIVLPVRNDIIDDKAIMVKENNIDKVNVQMSKNKAFVSGLLYGSDSVFSDGEMGEIERKIIKKENIDPRDFIIPEIPFISSSGSRRALLCSVEDLKYDLFENPDDKTKKSAVLEFSLRKGSYATSLLREFMKADDIRNY